MCSFYVVGKISEYIVCVADRPRLFNHQPTIWLVNDYRSSNGSTNSDDCLHVYHMKTSSNWVRLFKEIYLKFIVCNLDNIFKTFIISESKTRTDYFKNTIY